MRATTYFSGAIGGASEMTLLAERAGARTDLVAAAHSLRLVLVTVAIPFAMQWSGLHGLELHAAGPREVRWGGLALLVLATGVGGVAMRLAGRTNPWFIGPLLVSMGFAVAGQPLSAVPAWLSNAAQLVIAVSLGVRFSREFLHTAPRWLATVALGTLGMIVAVRRLRLAAGLGHRAASGDADSRAPRRAASPRWRSPPRCFSWGCRW